MSNVGKEVVNTSNSLEQAAKKSQSLRGQLSGLKQQITLLEQSGQTGSKAFTDLTIQAAKLEDQIGDTRERVRVLASDTFKFGESKFPKKCPKLARLMMKNFKIKKKIGTIVTSWGFLLIYLEIK